MMTGPSDAAILERARSLCNQACLMVALQHRRVRTAEPEDEIFFFRRFADVQFLIIALRRVRRSAELAKRVPGVSEVLRNAISEFDRTLPGLAKMRNVGEHIDIYAVDGRNRHHPDVVRGQLQVGEWDGTTYPWLGESLNIDAALDAAKKLFEAVKQAATGSLRDKKNNR
ncbi:MAG: hypothetical protein ACREQB_03405 [Candidatus Binataceae bacterium]